MSKEYLNMNEAHRRGTCVRCPICGAGAYTPCIDNLESAFGSRIHKARVELSELKPKLLWGAHPVCKESGS